MKPTAAEPLLWAPSCFRCSLSHPSGFGVGGPWSNAGGGELWVLSASGAVGEMAKGPVPGRASQNSGRRMRS